MLLKLSWGLGCKNSLLAREAEKVPWRWSYGPGFERIKIVFIRRNGAMGALKLGRWPKQKWGGKNISVWLGWDEPFCRAVVIHIIGMTSSVLKIFY